MLTIERDDDDKDATEELNLEDDGFEDLKHTDWDSEALMTLESIVEKIDSIDTLNDQPITANVDDDEDIVIQLPVESEHPAEETAKIVSVEITAPAASVSGIEKTTSVAEIPSAEMKAEPKKKARVRPWRTKRQAAGSVGPEPAAAAKPKQSKPQEARRERAKEFFCSKCHQGFTMKSNCIRHEKYECGQKPRFMCPHCGLRCKQTSQIYVHIRRKHPNEEIYVISVENSRDKKKARTAASKRIFLRSVPRILRHRGSRECHSQFQQPQQQQQQRETISVPKTKSDRNSDSHPGTLLACPDCGKKFHTEQGLILHIKSQHYKERGIEPEPRSEWLCISTSTFHRRVRSKYTCLDCDRTFGIRAEMLRHRERGECQSQPLLKQMKHKMSQILKIETNNREQGECQSQPQLQQQQHTDTPIPKIGTNNHVTTKSNYFLGPFSCSVCRKTYIYPMTPDGHNRDFGTVCTFCEEKMKNKVIRFIKTRRCYLPLDELVNARRTRHRIDRSRPFMVCQSCGRTYTHRHNLLKHMKHECGGQRHYSCHICHIRFTQKSSVKRHLAFKHLSGV
ncbi:zinc finger protein 585A-like [Trichogramma pretiosum]|uniref:zinc finger protein 585A-like n=1 Tax=Trichogramma pretiosum TaxID=7493 RepID=UPI0006C9B306|nr:zinc finger protein 585A-like [Trichogramma pretiosum]